MKNVICIFCLNDFEHNSGSVEHVIPDALGGCLVLPKNYCCKNCNSLLGHVIDSRLVDFFSAARVVWDIRSSKNKKHEPTANVFIGIQPKSRIPALIRPKKWVEVAHPLKLKNGYWVFPNEKSQKEFIENHKRKGNEIKLIRKGEFSKSAISFTIPQITEYHLRAFVKIAYNLAAYKLSSTILNDDFQKVREYIISGKHDINIYYPDPQANYGPIRITGRRTYKTPYLPHYLALSSTRDRRLLAMINIFRFIYVVQLCENYPDITHFLCYLYHADRKIDVIPDYEMHEFLETSYWSFQLGPTIQLLTQDDLDNLPVTNDYTDYLINFYELDKI